MEESATRWCSAPGCMLNVKIAKRHFFRFPKEKERWLEWIKACNRMDLITIGPEYANRYYRLCHLHFRVELFRNIEGKIYLSKEAVPSIFLKLVQAGNSKSTEMLQPVSFVTVYLKPESKNRNSSTDLSTPMQSKVSQTHPMKPNEKDTAIISPLQALFPKASIKQSYEDTSNMRDIPSAQTTLLKMKSESKNSTASDVQFVKEVCVGSSASTTLRTSNEKFTNGNDIIDLTSTDSSVPATSLKTASVQAIQQNEDRTSKRRRWHISTQTPDAWRYVNFFLGKRQMEKSETDIENLAAKRRRMPNADNEYYRADVDQFKEACTDLLPHNFALLVSACINARERRKIKRNFEDRQFALKLFFMTPDAYRFYQPLCLWPTVRQLWRHIRNWDIPPGLNDNVLNTLHLKLKSLSPIERHCCLCVKEMQLRPHLFYNLSRDRIVGFHDTGIDKRRTLARKALVMMARSLAGDWEQPIAYYFYSDVRCTSITKNLIFQTIIRLKSIGATVHTLITSTAPTFLRLTQHLGISIERPSFLVNNEKVFYIFDVARLIRLTRNIFINHEFQFREKRASWADIKQFFRRDNQMRLPLVPKLSVDHLEPSRCQKTETKYAAQVFSNSIAAGLSAYIASGEFPVKAIGTIEFVHIFDQVFDILNSSASMKTSTKDFSQAFTGNVHEMDFLQQTLDFLKSIKVIDENGTCVKSIKCFDRWQITINAVIQLWSALKEHQLLFLRTRRLNQEGIEHIFRSIRRQSGNRAKPTPILFTRAFKNLVSKHFLEHSSENDSGANAQRVLKRIASEPSLRADEVPPAATQIALNVAATNYRDIDLRLPEKSAFKRVCEFLLNECLYVHVNCDTCVAYAAKEGKDTPSSFSLYISDLEDMFMRNFEELSAEENLGARMLQFVEHVKYKPPCPDFPIAFLLKLFLRMRIYFTLSRHNKICKGVESRHSLNVMQL